jgi:hypothetical protein
MPGGHGDAAATSLEVRSVSCSLNGVKSESVRTTVTLARDYFPQVISMNGYSNSKWPALAHHLNQWKTQGVTINTIRLLMDEFGRHPEWIRRSNKPPWRVFVAMRDDLEALLATRQRRDPGNRKWSAGQGDEYWLGRHTPRSYSPA